MALKYKIWLHIEEQDESDDHYQEVYEPIYVDREFDLLYDAVDCAETLKRVGDCSL